MPTVSITPLSVNRCWQGRRFKTQEYGSYEYALLYLLPPLSVPNGFLVITIIFGMSNKNSDIDNPVKPFLDVLQKKYGFNDRQIYELHVTKKIVSKGCEFISFDISQ